MLNFLESFLNELRMTPDSCTDQEIEDLINANLTYFRRKFLKFYFEDVETFSDIENCTLEEIEENFTTRCELGHRELYYISASPFKLLPIDKKLLASNRSKISASKRKDIAPPTIRFESTPRYEPALIDNTFESSTTSEEF